MHQTTLGLRPSDAIRTSMLRGGFMVPLIVLLAFGPGVPSARAASSDEKLLSITKTTIYGALLGGLLGLATTLIVDEGDRDNAVRWGVALGTFGGFAYGVATSDEEDDFEDFTLRHPRNRWNDTVHFTSVGPGWRRLSALGSLRGVRGLDQDRPLLGIEVRNGGLEEKGGGEETVPGNQEEELRGE